MDENLQRIFDIDAVENTDTPSLPLVVSSEDQKEDDYDLARSTLRDLISKNETVLTDLIHLARNSEHPRAFEVVGQLVKTQSEIAKDLLGIHKQKREIDGGDTPQNIKTQNNIVFAGSTSDLLKVISQQRAKPIDAS